MARCISVDLTAFLEPPAKLFKTSSEYSCCSLPQGEISAIARENSGVSFILCQTLEFCPLYRMLFFSPIRRFMYSRSTLCAFQYLPWCAAAVCDPISRLGAWTKAEVISMGCISIFIAFIWIFAFPVWYHSARRVRRWLEVMFTEFVSNSCHTTIRPAGTKHVSGLHLMKFTCSHIYSACVQRKARFSLRHRPSWGGQTLLEVYGKLTCLWWIIDFFIRVSLRLFHPRKTVHHQTLVLWHVSRNVFSFRFRQSCTANVPCRRFLLPFYQITFPDWVSPLKRKSELNAHRIWLVWRYWETRGKSHDTGQFPAGGSPYNPAYLGVGSWGGCSDGLSCEVYAFVLPASQQNCLWVLWLDIKWRECFGGAAYGRVIWMDEAH